MYANNESYASPDQNKKTGGLYRPYRPLADINCRANTGSSSSEEVLPKIYEESEEEKENIPHRESTPRRLVNVIGENDDDFISSTPLSRRHHVTPKTTKPWIPYNPFEQDLLPKLHLPVCSPSVFSTVLSPTSNLKEDFDWPIEDISRIKPAAIDEDLDSLQILMHSTQHDAETESKVQQAIDTFFNEKSKIVPSPWSSESDRVPLIQETPCTPNHVSTQTALSLPPILPPDLEAALKPYFNQDENDCSASSDGASWELQDFQKQEEAIVLNQSGLRRKLLFHMSEGACFPSPAATSPLTDGCWKQGFSRSNIQISRELRSPTLSPIGLTVSPDYAKMKEVALSSSHMSVDVSFQSTPTTSSYCQQRRSLIMSENTCTSWTSQQHLYKQQDQNMDSCHSTPVKGETHVSSDQGYHTHSDLMDSHNK